MIDGEIGHLQSAVVSINHQSWYDKPVLLEIITGDGPIIKFLIKRELALVPVIGWICLALNFPRLYRGTGDDRSRQSNFVAIEAASINLGYEPGVLLIFPEGTRFTESKKSKQESPYRHLLIPKTGGMKIVQKSLDPSTPVIDITICYEQGISNFWRCMYGDVRKIYIKIEHFTLGDIEEIPTWLDSRWRVKDERIQAILNR